MSPLNWFTVVLVSALLIGCCWFGLHQVNNFTPFWPFLFLLGYVFFPEVSYLTAVSLTFLTITAVFLTTRTSIPIPSTLLNSIITLSFFILYVVTLSPDVLPADNGEFQWIATQLGVAHPPGFTLYTLLGNLASRLPIGETPAYRINYLSAVIGAVTLSIVFQTIIDLTKNKLAAVTAVITLGTATTFWAQSTIANIRSLTGFFAALFLFCLIRFAGKGTRMNTDEHGLDWWLAGAAFALGWGGTHHPSLVFIGIIGIMFILIVQPSLITQPRKWIRPFLFGISGLLPLLYLPLRASSGAPGAKQNLATLNGFLDHVLARGFSGDFFYFIAPDVLWERFPRDGQCDDIPVQRLAAARDGARAVHRDTT